LVNLRVADDSVNLFVGYNLKHMPYMPTGEQAAVLGYDFHRHARVLAAPGAGKSATLVALVDHLLAGNPAPRAKLLTFTRAATAELAKKVFEYSAAAFV
jgi:superfamily I DNA/RNA helicase